ncbi:MAG: type I-E CRISPR-associated protein Cse2/CasB [bacterium]|nr:type I-E CRISPR-associated protein Cse2/CasB [bacterium]
MTNKRSRDGNFIEFLESLRDNKNRMALAVLRRGLGRPPGTVLSMSPYIETFRPEPWQRAWYYLVAALFASYPGPEPSRKPDPLSMKERQNIGVTMDGIVHAYVLEGKGMNKDDARKRVERRFMALLNSHPDDLPRHLMHAISLAKSKDVPVDYRRLLRDLQYWTSENKWVQLQWAASFWGGSALPEPKDVCDEDEEMVKDLKGDDS